MSKISNSLLMLFYLNNKNTYTKISELSDYLEVSDREIRRYRDDLDMAGFSIESKMGRDGGYRLMLDVVLTMNINHIKHVLLHYSNNYGFITKLTNEGMLDVIKSLKDENLISAHLLPKEEVENLVKINLAIKTRHKLELSYSVNNFIVKQIVEPYLIKNIRDKLYLFALNDNILKTYRISNIKEIIPINQSFVFDQRIYQKEKNEDAYGVYRSDKKEIVRFEVFGKMNDFTYDTFLGKIRIIEEKEKSKVYELESYNLRECLYPLLSLGSALKILSPDDMISINREEIKKIKKYF
jgi:predicted DNA-binding transcriptional regulator YafY